MGRLENGKWIDQWHNTKETKGRYVRKPSIYRNWITKDGAAGPSGKDGLKQKQIDIIFMYPGLVHGLTEP